jgi:hypothetical protein
VRHLADTEDDIDVIFQEFGNENLLNYLAPALETDNGDILLQVSGILLYILSRTFVNFLS